MSKYDDQPDLADNCKVGLCTSSRLSMAADVFLAIGSSLVVEPAASLPRLAKRSGARLAIINQTQTPLDPLADLVIREPIGATMRRADRQEHRRTASTGRQPAGDRAARHGPYHRVHRLRKRMDARGCSRPNRCRR